MSWENDVKNWNGKLYKVLVNGESYYGGNHKWSLPEGGEPGEWTPVIDDVKMYKRGYHLTTHYAHWSGANVEVYEAEGDVVEFDGHDKVVCSKARLLERVENPFSDGYRNSGFYNSGDHNSGDRNSGSWNSGDRNSGYRNSGNDNSGDENSGDCNSGDRNSGNENSGDRNSGNVNFGNWNSGCCNSGDYNSGYMNSGDWNSGDRNSGLYNSGYKNSGHGNSGNENSGHCNSGSWNSGNNNSGNWNSGHGNSGHWNSGNKISGHFCTKTPPKYLFNKPVPEGWNGKFPNWTHFKLLSEGYEASWQEAFKNAPIEGVKELINLPNFDFKIFEKISSITEEQIRDKLGDF
jgi:PPE-repeat protein